jgi:hypothetical protein
MAIMEYKQKFDVHIILFFFLGELDKVCIFVNGLDNHIKFMVKAYNPKTLSKAYRGLFMVVVPKNGKNRKINIKTFFPLVFTNKTKGFHNARRSWVPTRCAYIITIQN